jgi:sugar phosphate isomerase/epimerase
MPIGKFIEFTKDSGAEGIEILDAFLYEPGVVRDHLPSSDAVERFISEARGQLLKTGIKVHGVCVTNDLNFEDPVRLKIERDKIELGIKLAKALSAPVVRVFSGNPTNSDEIELVRYRAIDALKDLANPQVVLALENHGAVFATPPRLISILDPLKSHNVGLCFDIGNFLLADVDSVEAARTLPIPSLIHIKDFKPDDTGGYRSNHGKTYSGCRLGEGIVPIEPVLKILFGRLEGRPMALDLELECGDDGIEATRHGVAWVKNLLSC